MKTVIRTWGNSLAVRIPHAFAMHLGMASGKEVEMILDSSGLRITSADYDLETMLKDVTPETVHAETHTGPLTGKEIW